MSGEGTVVSKDITYEEVKLETPPKTPRGSARPCDDPNCLFSLPMLNDIEFDEELAKHLLGLICRWPKQGDEFTG